ncbi:hypothetical protein [Methylocapsa palsarum]|uniref:Uncharacterized protein n=1 Tax=Methylocapsa palsarum TaxID=1612308 RepID=A0A1I3Z8I7_9HYPH|nr:hypothetical protein [Methylocapsa palsarum]SFK39869.1 hypothetical protein SAMN05444581_107120 [Methylocapsa palsarum]
MLVFAAGSFVIGALLAHFFKFYSLFPVAVLAVLLILLNPYDAGWSWRGLFLQSTALVAMLQIGYLSGAALHVYFPKAMFKGAFAPRRTAGLAGLRPRRKI